MKILFFLLLSLTVSQSIPMSNADVFSISDSIHKMTGSLYLEEILLSPDQNVVLSPLSIHLAMAMLYQGAAGNSSKQLGKALGLDGVQQKYYLESLRLVMEHYKKDTNHETTTLEIANGIFVSQEFEVNPEYKDLLLNPFKGAIISDIDGEVINEWVSEKTKNHIKKVVPEDGLDASTKVALVNAVYFKAKWMKQFDEAKTSKAIFTTNVVDIMADFMFLSSELEFARSEELNAKIVALPYMSEDYKMIILHPEESSSIEHLEMALFNNSQSMTFQQHLSKMRWWNVDLLLPKFAAGSDLQLVQHFQQLGVVDIFGPGADLSGIFEGSSPIGSILHKTKIEVSEEGSEAAAATVVYATKTFIPNQKMTVDSPFIFFIVDTVNNVPIFMGKIVNPSEQRLDVKKKEIAETEFVKKKVIKATNEGKKDYMDDDDEEVSVEDVTEAMIEEQDEGVIPDNEE